MPRASEIMNNVATAMLVACALLVTALVVRREFEGPAPESPVVRSIGDWERLLDGGHRIGPADAELQLVEFSDFQCPYCRRSAFALDSLLRRFDGRLAIIYRHFPLEAVHPHAFEAAMAAECAAAQNAFVRLHDALFQHQERIGEASWAAIAAAADVPDAEQLATCVQERTYARRVADDVSVANEIGVRATPTFVVRGRVVRGVMSVDDWERLLRDLG